MNVRSNAKVTSKGQITLPVVVRKQLGVAAGDVVSFEVTDDGIRVTRNREPAVFDRWIGRLRNGQGATAAEINVRLRIERGHEEQ